MLGLAWVGLGVGLGRDVLGLAWTGLGVVLGRAVLGRLLWVGRLLGREVLGRLLWLGRDVLGRLLGRLLGREVLGRLLWLGREVLGRELEGRGLWASRSPTNRSSMSTPLRVPRRRVLGVFIG